MNSINLQIEMLFNETVKKLDAECNRHVQFLDSFVPNVMAQCAASKPERYVGLVCPPSEERSRRKKQESEQGPWRGNLFTPYASPAVGSRTQNAQMFVLPDVTPVGGRKRPNAKSDDIEDDRASISTGKRLPGQKKKEERKVMDEPAVGRRSLRLNGGLLPDTELKKQRVGTPPRAKPRRSTVLGVDENDLNGSARKPLEEMRDGQNVRRSIRLMKKDVVGVQEEENFEISTPPRVKARREKQGLATASKASAAPVFAVPAKKSVVAEKGAAESKVEVEPATGSKIRNKKKGSVLASEDLVAVDDIAAAKAVAEKKKGRAQTAVDVPVDAQAEAAANRRLTRSMIVELAAVAPVLETPVAAKSKAGSRSKAVTKAPEQEVVEEVVSKGSRIAKRGRGSKVQKDVVEVAEVSNVAPTISNGKESTGRKVSGKKIAQLMSKWEPEVVAKVAPETNQQADLDNNKKTEPLQQSVQPVAEAKAAKKKNKTEEDKEEKTDKPSAAFELSRVESTIKLTEEQGLDLSSRLEAIVNGALLQVSSSAATAVPLPKKKAPVVANQRAEAWRSHRSVQHNSFRDLLAANGIVPADAGTDTIQAALEAIPQVVGEIGDEAAKSVSSASSNVNSDKTNVNNNVNNNNNNDNNNNNNTANVKKNSSDNNNFNNFSSFSTAQSTAKAPSLIEDDSGVSDSEDEEVVPELKSYKQTPGKKLPVRGPQEATPPPKPVGSVVSSFAARLRENEVPLTSTTSAPAITFTMEDRKNQDAVPSGPLAASAPLPSLLTKSKIQGLKERIYNSSMTTGLPVAAPSLTKTNGKDQKDSANAKEEDEDEEEGNISINLRAAFDPNASAHPVTVNSLHVVMNGSYDAEESMGLTNQSIAPGLFTVEISTPDRVAISEYNKTGPIERKDSLDVKRKAAANSAKQIAAKVPSPATTKAPVVMVAQVEKLAPESVNLFDGSFVSADSDVYNTLDAEKALNAVQYLEQIQLNQTNLHDITLTAPLDLSGGDEMELGSEQAGVSKASKKRSVEDFVSELKTSGSNAQTSIAKPDSAVQSNALSVQAPVVLQSQQSKLPVPQPLQRTKSGESARDENAVPPTAKMAKIAGPASASAPQILKAAPVAPVPAPVVQPVVGLAAKANKQDQAKERREKLEEEERKKKEDKLRKAADRELKARALKDSKLATVATKPVGGTLPVAPTAVPPTVPVPASLAPKPVIAEEVSSKKVAIIEKYKMQRKANQTTGATSAPTIQAGANGSAQLPVAAQQQQSSAAPEATKKGGFLQNLNKLVHSKKGSAPSVAGPPPPPTVVATTAAPVLPAPVVATVEKPFFTHHGPVKETSPISAKVRSPQQPRPSPLRKAAAQALAIPGSPAPAASGAKESSTQYSISPYKASDVEGDDSQNARRKKMKHEAKWAKKDVLQKLLQDQHVEQADEIFGVVAGLTCDLTDIFKDYKPRHKVKVAARGSSAQWSDVPTIKPVPSSSLQKK